MGVLLIKVCLKINLPYLFRNKTDPEKSCCNSKPGHNPLKPITLCISVCFGVFFLNFFQPIQTNFVKNAYRNYVYNLTEFLFRDPGPRYVPKLDEYEPNSKRF